MFLYLIELYFLGTLLFSLLNDDLPPVFQAVGGILLGFLLHVLNGLVLIGIGIGLSQAPVVILPQLSYWLPSSITSLANPPGNYSENLLR